MQQPVVPIVIQLQKRFEYVLVGHSFGGLAVRLYAARHLERVRGLTWSTLHTKSSTRAGATESLDLIAAARAADGRFPARCTARRLTAGLDGSVLSAGQACPPLAESATRRCRGERPFIQLARRRQRGFLGSGPPWR